MRHQLATARVGRLASAIALALSGATVATSANAQAASRSRREAVRSLEEITVTGSRIRRDDFSSPQPTTVMDNQYLQNLGVINLGQAMVRHSAERQSQFAGRERR